MTYVEATALRRPRAGLRRYTAELVRRMLPDDDTTFLVQRKARFQRGRWVVGTADDWTAHISRADEGTVVHDLSNGFALGEVAVGSHVRVMVTLHDAIPLSCPGIPEEVRRGFLEVVPRMVERAHIVVTPSYAAAEEIHEHVGVEWRKLRVIYPGVSAIFRRRDASDLRTLLKLPTGALVVATTGVYLKRKNTEVLLRALGGMRARSAYLRENLVLVIGGWIREDRLVHLGAYAHKYGVVDSTIFTGELSDKQLAELYSTCDVFAYPSIAEGFGLPPLEALACGARVVASDIRVFREVLGGRARLGKSVV